MSFINLGALPRRQPCGQLFLHSHHHHKLNVILRIIAKMACLQDEQTVP